MNTTFFRRLSVSIVLLLTISAIYAEVITDGTLGTASALPGPNYLIGADLGKQYGGNLFHSFQNFNLQKLESATFSGPVNINNVISRVTGGNPSVIDGLIRSTIPSADMYFLNPAGIMFGPNASLDVQGSFHASTANYLRLKDGGRFDARNPSDSLLTIAPIEAFGFFGNSEAISIEGSLEVSSEKTLSLIGGNLTIKGNGTTPNLSAPSGRINLIGVASEGEVNIDELDGNFVDVSSFTKLAEIYIKNGLVQTSNTDLDGIGINVKAGQLILNDGRLVTKTDGTGKGGDININVTDTVNLYGDKPLTIDDLSFSLNELISTRTYNSGTGGNIKLNVGQLYVKNGRQIGALTFTNGQGGNIDITATEDIIIEDGIFLEDIAPIPSIIGTQSAPNSAGKVGNIYLKARNNIVLRENAMINSTSFGSGNTGDINLKARQLLIKNGAQIGLSTYGTGNGGNINATITENVTISGKSFINGMPNGIFSSSDTPFYPEQSPSDFISGKAGKIQLQTNELIMRGSGPLMRDSLREATAVLSVSTYWGSGNSGDLTIDARRIDLVAGSVIRARSLERANGDAGNIYLNVKDWLRMQNSFILTTAEEAAGGNISINSPGYMYLTDSEISSSVFAKEGNGGNIILKPEFIVLDNSSILAQAFKGHGGNIYITTTGIYEFKSIIDASSKFGVDGQRWIPEPTILGIENFTRLPIRFFVADIARELSINRCTLSTGDLVSSFIITARDIPKTSPYDLQTHSILLNPLAPNAYDLDSTSGDSDERDEIP